MSEQALAIYQQCTGRQSAPSQPLKEAWLIIGRRGGKSRMLALLAVYVACFKSYEEYLSPGERGMVMIVAADRKQAKIILKYVKAFFRDVPMLTRLVERQTADTFDLINSVSIEISTASFRTVRGYTVVAALCDELAFWRSDESSNPDEEVLGAIRPSMATIPGAVLLCASSPHAQRGALWNSYARNYGKDNPDILVWQAATRTMNPSVPQSFIDREIAADPAKATAEYYATFRTDIEEFLARHAVLACIEPGVYERPPNRIHRYCGFIDPSGGVNDAMTMGIAHAEGESGAETVILDLVREVKAPFSPEAVVSQFTEILKTYRVSKVYGDRYGSEWVREQFRNSGVDYDPSDKNRSELYSNLLPIIMSRSADLLDNDRMVDQLVTLERRTTVGKRDAIDHRPGAHDDIAKCGGRCTCACQSIKGHHPDQLHTASVNPKGEMGPLARFSNEETSMNVIRLRPVEPPNPVREVLERLAELETLIVNLPIPEPPNLEFIHGDTATILERLRRLEATVIALAHRPATYTFEIKRDFNGKLIRVTAHKVFDN